MNYRVLFTIAGLILALKPFLKRQAMPSAKGFIETVHYLPGRLRLHIPSLAGKPEAAQTLRKQMEMLDHITSLQVNTINGSVLILFDPAAIDPEILFGATARILGIDEKLTDAGEPVMWQEIRSAGQAIDHALHSSSGGYVDVKTLFTILLLAIVVYRLVKQPDRLGVPGTVTLGYWLFNLIFMRGA